MAQVFLIGSITADLKLRQSEKKVSYIRFGISERIEYKGGGGRQDYQVWAFGFEAERLAKMNVKKGSLFWVSGELRLVDDLRTDFTGTVKVLKIIFKDGGYAAKKILVQDEPLGCPHLDGEREPLPE